MNKAQWDAFVAFRDAFRTKCAEWNTQFSDVLKPLQKAAAKKDTPDYPLETAVVYNRAFDDVTPADTIRYFVIGDNPGKDEQLAKNNRYLVGQSGKIAAGFFARNPEFKTDFRKNVLILNKTPVHTAKTSHLKSVTKAGGKDIQDLVFTSQAWMAEQTARLHTALCAAADSENPAPELWLVGYAELKGKGLFLHYRDVLRATYPADVWQRVYVFQHFSMNRFLIDLKNYRESHTTLSLQDAVHALGEQHRCEIFTPIS
ncbi:MAG: hypothetical protein IJS09_06295 [Treponema sp.]|nr:hypothetical protein [Treponema sp.]